jgi:hypothetical protein
MVENGSHQWVVHCDPKVKLDHINGWCIVIQIKIGSHRWVVHCDPNKNWITSRGGALCYFVIFLLHHKVGIVHFMWSKVGHNGSHMDHRPWPWMFVTTPRPTICLNKCLLLPHDPRRYVWMNVCYYQYAIRNTTILRNTTQYDSQSQNANEVRLRGIDRKSQIKSAWW